MIKLWLFSWLFPISPFVFYKLQKENLSNENCLNILKNSCYIKFILDASSYITIFAMLFVLKGLDGIIVSIILTILLVYIPSWRFSINLKKYFKDKEIPIYIKNKSTDLEDYLNTGEIFKFEYKGEKDSYYRKREIVIERIYYKNGIKYIKGYDLESSMTKSFREDRILESF